MFIIDQNHHLIAAEKEDLEQWNYPGVYEAAQAFASDEIRFEPELNMLLLGADRSIHCHVDHLESTMGAWYLCRAKSEDKHSSPESTAPYSVASSQNEETLEVPPAEGPDNTIPVEETKETRHAPLPEELHVEDEELEALLNLLPEEESQDSAEVTEESEKNLHPEAEVTSEEKGSPTATLEQVTAPPSEEKEEILHTGETASPSETEDFLPEERSLDNNEELPLQLLEEETFPLETETGEPRPSSPETAVQDVEEEGIADWEQILEEFHPDLPANASHLGLPNDEYTALLRDLLHDTRLMEEDLLGDDPRKRHEAVSLLKDAVTLLQLNPLDRLPEMLENAEASVRKPILLAFEKALGSVTASDITASEAREDTMTAPEAPPAPTTGIPAAENEERGPRSAEEEAHIQEFLKGVEPIPISFSLHVAAEELSLPEDLVQEFVTDFANQGHEYLPILIEAYERKDLEKLQKTAHMLKGAASNLRVEAMVENLYELQFDNDIERAPERIRKFAGQLMSLDNFLKQLNG